MKVMMRNNTLIATLVKGWKCAEVAYADKSRRYRRKQQWKIFYHILISPFFACKWFELLKKKELGLIFKYRKTLYIKPFRVYMSIRWNKAHKVKVIEDTYRFILQRQEVFMPFITGSSVPLARLQFSNGYEGFISITYTYRYRKEGELVVMFECEELGGIVEAAAFSFEEIDDGQWICRIGCVQGKHNEDPSSYPAKMAQKLMYGLRPKALVVFAVQELVRKLGIVGLYGAGDSIQAYRRKHAIHIPWLHSIHFKYNSFWPEIDGCLSSRGWYELPLTMRRKDLSELKTSKRALHRRRYAMLDDLSEQIGDKF